VGARAFYSRQNAAIPLLASAVTGVVFIAVGIPFASWWGASGIAWATSLAFSVEMVLLFIMLTRKMKRTLEIIPTLSRLLIGTVIGGLVTLVALNLLPGPAWIVSALAMVCGFAVAVVFLFKDIRQVLLA
jgi:peptidoglycan biosynthesis protein MviN/MurJ (putative lipid II flippase)